MLQAFSIALNSKHCLNFIATSFTVACCIATTRTSCWASDARVCFNTPDQLVNRLRCKHNGPLQAHCCRRTCQAAENVRRWSRLAAVDRQAHTAGAWGQGGRWVQVPQSLELSVIQALQPGVPGNSRRGGAHQPAAVLHNSTAHLLSKSRVQLVRPMLLIEACSVTYS